MRPITLATITVAATLGVGVVIALGPALAAGAAAVGLFGALLHEGLHYVTAVSVGAQNVTLGWDATGPFVAYDGRVRPVVHLAPPFCALALAAWLTATTPFPSTSEWSVLTASFLAGLHSLSPTDYRPLWTQ